MKLDRNVNETTGRGKYALLLLRKLDLYESHQTFGGLAEPIREALEILEEEGILDWGITDTESEFFLIRLKDKYARAALLAYAEAAKVDDREWADEVLKLADKAGPLSPHCKKPD